LRSVGTGLKKEVKPPTAKKPLVGLAEAPRRGQGSKKRVGNRKKRVFSIFVLIIFGF